MTPATPPESFESQVLSRLDKIDSDLTSLNKAVEKQQTRLDNLFNGLVTVLVSVVLASSLLILVRNGIEVWLALK